MQNTSILDQETIISVQKPVRPTAMRYGLIASVVLIILNLVYYLGDMIDFSQPSFFNLPNLLNYAVMIGTAALALKHYRDVESGGILPFRKTLPMGWWLGLVMGLVTAVWVVVFFQIISPELIDQIRQVQMEKMEDQGMSEEQISASSGMMETFTGPFAMAFCSLISTVIMMIIFSMIAGIFLKNETERIA